MSAADSYPVLRLLQSHLEGRLRRGESRLWLAGEAADDLRDIIRMKPRPRAQAPAVQVSVPAAVDSTPRPVISAAPARLVLPVQDQAAAAQVESLPTVGRDSAAGTPAEEMPGGGPPLGLAEKERLLESVKARAEAGVAARALGTLRPEMVFATGSPMAEIVFVGEAPGAEEERQGEPFVGPAGQLLTRVIRTMGVDRGGVYITNICKFRPAMESQGSKNRAPTEEEMGTCLDFVREEIRIVRPRVIVALGGTAITGLLGLKGGVTKLRGQFYRFEDIPVMATFHPSYLLHREKDGPEASMAEKRKFWEDMLQVMTMAGLEVTEKHRGFFLPK